MLSDTVAAQGLMSIAIIVPPTMWAVVPPGTGMLYIITRKAKAVRTPSRGTWLGFRFLSHRKALYQIGIIIR